MTALRALGVCLALLLACRPGAAGEISVKLRGCKAGVELVARDAPLPQVLERLSKSLGFRLDVAEPIAGDVNLRVTASGPELVAQLLATQERVMVAHERDPACPGRSRVARIWLLPLGQQVARREPREPTPKAAALAQVATTEQLRNNEARAQQLKQDYDEHLRRHGKPPPGEEQEEAKP